MATPQECREEIHRLLTDTLPGNGVEAADIYAYRTARFRDEYPVHIFVTTHKIWVEPLTQSDQLPHYFFRIFFAARYNDQASELAAEDALDLLELLTVQTLAAAETTAVWEALNFLSGPERTSMEILGKFYRTAQQIVQVEITNA
jgi:hypothetical protein